MEALSMATELANHGGWGPGPWWPLFPIFWVAFWGVLIFAVFRFRGRGWRQSHSSAADLLADRYARGDITVDEYRERLRVLEEHGAAKK